MAIPLRKQLFPNCEDTPATSHAVPFPSSWPTLRRSTIRPVWGSRVSGPRATEQDHHQRSEALHWGTGAGALG